MQIIQRKSQSKEKKHFIKGVILIFFACLVNMALGTIFLWGNLSDFMKIHFDSQKKADIVYPLSVMMMGICSLGSQPISNKLGTKRMFLIFGTILVASLVALSFIRNYWLFLFIYLFGFALPIGFVYILPLACAYDHFPKKKGIAGGILLAGFTFGSFIFGLVSEAVINPENLKKDDLTKDQNIDDRISIFFWILAVFFAITHILAMIFVKYPEVEKESLRESLMPQQNQTVNQENLVQEQNQTLNQDSQNVPQTTSDEKESAKFSNNKLKKKKELENIPVEQQKNECKSFKQAFSSLIFYQLIIIPLFQAYFGQYIISQYKPFAGNEIDEETLTVIGSCSMVANALGRISWGALMDRFGYKRVYYVATTLQLILSCTITFVVPYVGLYAVYICLSLLCMSNLTSTMPAFTVIIFGPKFGKSMIAYTYLTFCFSNVISFCFSIGGVPISTGLWVGFGLTAVCFVNGLFLKEKKVWN